MAEQTKNEAICLVNTPERLIELTEAIRQAPRIAVDTEFHAERRYQPQLMLVQIATGPGAVWLLDPLAVDPTPALSVISNQELIVHSGTHDLRLIAALGARPTRIFDTQQAAGLLGLRYPERLSTLIAHFLDVPMDKGSTLSDWSARPLTSRQIRYAAADALLLLPLAERLMTHLSQRDRLGWAWELGEELRTNALEADRRPNLIDSWEICSRLDDDALKVLDALQTWRFEQAERRDKPPYYLLPDSMLLDLARRRPTSIRALSENRRLNTGLVKRHGRDILGCIQNAQRAPLARFPPTLPERQKGRVLSMWAELVGEPRDISPKLLLPEPLNVVREGTAALTGWRSTFHDSLKNLLTGQEVITFSNNGEKVHLKKRD
ncbi:MAG: HRDC domain-containing protein [Myxococcota bacterium]|nr:HRDC domain-containing protein [Myxococcota bacterium]